MHIRYTAALLKVEMHLRRNLDKMVAQELSRAISDCRAHEIVKGQPVTRLPGMHQHIAPIRPLLRVHTGLARTVAVPNFFRDYRGERSG